MSDGNGQQHFFPWLRRGMCQMITAVDSPASPVPIRPVLNVNLTVTPSTAGVAGTQQTAAMAVNLHGPCDVTGIAADHIKQTEPWDLTPNFEPNYFCGIEFDDPDAPWLFTPAAPDNATNRLRPWLSLIALKKTEYTQGSPNTPITVTNLDALPDLSESWAWCHTQVTGDIPSSGVSSVISDAPHAIISRILCPRKLEPDTAYAAFLVPAFEAGRLTLLGQDASAVQTTVPAWPPSGGATSVTLPVFTQFQFHTSSQGDFESLVRRLKATVLPATLGIRPMDVSQPGAGVPAASPTPLGLGGALRSVDTQDTAWQDPQKTAFQNEVKSRINQTSPLRDDPDNPVRYGPSADPPVVPPMYGRWHAGVTAVDQNSPGWVNDLNLDPRTRAMAGLGTRVVASQRVQLMASAWRQIQGVEQANQQLRQGQMAQSAMVQLFASNFQPASDETLLSLTSPVHSRIAASPKTVSATIAASRLPRRSLSPAFRRISAPRGVLRQRQGGPTANPASIVARLNSGEISPVPDYKAPDGMVSIDDVGQQLANALIPSWVPSWLRWIWRYILKVLLIAFLVLLVAFLLVAIIFGAGAAAVIGAVAAAALAAYLAIRSSYQGESIAQQLTLINLTADTLNATPPQPDFQISAVGSALSRVSGGGAADSPDAAAFRAAAAAMLARVHSLTPASPPAPPLATSTVRATVQERLDPSVTVAARMKALVNVTPSLPWAPSDPIAPIMAYPVFDQPMYEPLRDMSQDLLLPGLVSVPPDSLSLLSPNEVFIEAYMVGLNVAMERELLWNRYPCDQRGTPFRQFWDVRSYVPTANDPSNPAQLAEKLRDIPPIHRWRENSLGANSNRTDIQQGNLILLIRGELLRRYPKAVIYACEAAWDGEGHKRKLTTNERYPLFRGTLQPDITFVGFALDANTARGGDRDSGQPAGWFFVFQQLHSEPRFGLEPTQTAPLQTWDQLSWSDFAFTARADGSIFAQASVAPRQRPSADKYDWGSDAAQMAYITFRRPDRIAVHASLMLPPSGGAA